MAVNNFNFQYIAKGDGVWKIVVSPRPGSFEMDIWLLNTQLGKVQNANVDKNGYLVLTEVKDGDLETVPLMRVPGSVWQLIVEAITEETPSIKKEVVDAELSATKFHLADMRKLVFENLVGKNIISGDYLCGHGSCLPGKCNYKEEKK